MDFQSVLSFASFVILGAVIYMMGEQVKPRARVYLSGRALAVYERTLRVHPLLVALAVYQVPGFPLPEGFSTVSARILLGFACGLSTSECYRLYRKAMKSGDENA